MRRFKRKNGTSRYWRIRTGRAVGQWGPQALRERRWEGSSPSGEPKNAEAFHPEPFPTEGMNNHKRLKVVAPDMAGLADGDTNLLLEPTYIVFYYPVPVLLYTIRP